MGSKRRLRKKNNEGLQVSDNSQRLLLLDQVRGHLNLNNWEKFVKAIKVTTLTGQQVKRIHNNKGNVPGDLYECLVAFCRDKKISFGETVSEKRPSLTDDESAPGWAGFLGTLALTDEEGRKTANRFSGRYFYGLLDEDNTVAILNCHLSDLLT